MFKELSNLLGSKFGRKDELSRQLLIVKVFDIYRSELSQVFPDDKDTNPIILKNKILTVQTSSSSAANELRFHEEQIISRINQEIAPGTVKRIVYRF